MKKYFVVSDIHGFFDEMLCALKDASFDTLNPDHIIISCGDLLDRGEKPRECLQFMNSLFNKGRAVLIKGNHDDLLETMLNRGYPRPHDYSNGTVKTVMEMFPKALDINECWEAMKLDKDYFEYKSHLVDYYETDNYIFTHGFIPVSLTNKSDNKWIPTYEYAYNPNWRDANEVEWGDYPDGARWLNGMECSHNGINQTGKTIVVGHYHCSWGHARYENPDENEEFPMPQGKTTEVLKHLFRPYCANGIVAIDACTAYSKIVNVLVIDEKDI